MFQLSAMRPSSSDCREIRDLRAQYDRIRARPDEEDIYRRAAGSMGQPFRELFSRYRNVEGPIGGFIYAGDEYTKKASVCDRVAKLALALEDASK